MKEDELARSETSRYISKSDELSSHREVGMAVLGALGAVALTGCTSDDREPATTAIQELVGTDIKWVDTVLGVSPPSIRTGFPIARAFV